MSGNDRDEFSRAGDVLKNVFDKIVPDEAENYSRFFSGWDKIVGPELSMHVRPKEIINGSLILETDHPGWIQRMRMNQERYLKDIQKSYPELEIRKLRVVMEYRSGEDRASSVVPEEITEKNATESVGPKPSGVSSNNEKPAEDEKFFTLLEEMRRRAKS